MMFCYCFISERIGYDIGSDILTDFYCFLGVLFSELIPPGQLDREVSTLLPDFGLADMFKIIML